MPQPIRHGPIGFFFRNRDARLFVAGLCLFWVPIWHDWWYGYVFSRMGRGRPRGMYALWSYAVDSSAYSFFVISSIAAGLAVITTSVWRILNARKSSVDD